MIRKASVMVSASPGSRYFFVVSRPPLSSSNETVPT
jgi:hypothetical protein